MLEYLKPTKTSDRADRKNRVRKAAANRAPGPSAAGAPVDQGGAPADQGDAPADQGDTPATPKSTRDSSPDLIAPLLEKLDRDMEEDIPLDAPNQPASPVLNAPSRPASPRALNIPYRSASPVSSEPDSPIVSSSLTNPDLTSCFKY